MNYGISDIDFTEKSDEIVVCNMCGNYFYEEIGDERNTNSLMIFKDIAGFFKGCPKCKTDAYITDTAAN